MGIVSLAVLLRRGRAVTAYSHCRNTCPAGRQILFKNIGFLFVVELLFMQQALMILLIIITQVFIIFHHIIDVLTAGKQVSRGFGI